MSTQQAVKVKKANVYIRKKPTSKEGDENQEGSFKEGEASSSDVSARVSVAEAT